MVTIAGSQSCMEAPDSNVCNLAPVPIKSKKYRLSQLQQGSINSGICSVGEVAVSLDGTKLDDVLEYRVCDQHDSFSDGGYFTQNFTFDQFDLCKTELCNGNNSVSLLRISVFLFFLSLFLIFD